MFGATFFTHHFPFIVFVYNFATTHFTLIAITFGYNWSFNNSLNNSDKVLLAIQDYSTLEIVDRLSNNFSMFFLNDQITHLFYEGNSTVCLVVDNSTTSQMFHVHFAAVVHSTVIITHFLYCSLEMNTVLYK